MSTETKDEPDYRACASCGRPVFADLLDERGVCDYCREIMLREDKIPAGSGKGRKKKRKSG